MQLQQHERPQKQLYAVSDGISVGYCLYGVQKVGGSNPLAPTTLLLPQSPFMTGLVASSPSRGPHFRTSLSDIVQRQPER